MSDESPRFVHSASDILEVGVQLENVQFFNLQATINEDAEPTEEPSPAVAPLYGLKLRHEGNELGMRVSIELDTVTARIVVDASINYTTAEVIEIDEEAFLDFANNVGVMALLPYLRQAIADLSQRVLGDVILMPVIPRGELTFSRADAAK
ncbi:MAG TPA: hypothetical protein VN035_07530 [Microbacterium sp.]|nr:hypothetical protein [Microbacterium sp.]